MIYYKYMCVICGWIYDEKLGFGNIPPGTKWEDIDDEFFCPECGATKSEFVRI